MKFLPGNCIQLLRNGAEYFPALEQAINAAKREIHLEIYIFEHDETGRRIAEALKRAALRGVTVHLLIDGFGSKSLSREVVQDLRLSWVQVLFYRQEISSFSLKRRRLRRLHRKIAVIDGRVAFVGGINIIDDMDTPHQTPPRFDYAVRVEGPLLKEIHPVVRRLWTLVSWAQLRSRRSRRLKERSVARSCGDMAAAFVIRDNIRHRRDIEDFYLDAIRDARREIVIANAYFLPGQRFRRALMDAARRGVRVVLLLQGKVEYLLLHYATRALYGALLEAGVEIHEYHKSFLHAKVAVIDGEWATVGSSNLDPFSFLLAKEANVVVRDQGFASELRASLEQAMDDGARKLEPLGWSGQFWTRRAASWLAYGLVRFMMGVTGYARQEESD
jgi:cardiolipin synthase